MTPLDSPRRHIAYTADGVWRLQPDIVRRFIETEPDYAALCREVAYILAKRSEAPLASPATITWRSKTLNSFLEKIQRGSFLDPFGEIRDRAGVRVVCDYDSDCAVVGRIIESEFDVVEAYDRARDLGVDKFGYRARHYLVKLGQLTAGARYDSLRELPCEIQVRTVLQDAWAVLQHHLFYKDEERIPEGLLRSAHALAALLEHADLQFELLRTQRDEYVAQIRESLADQERFLLNELTLESFIQYLQWRFPGRPVERHEGQVRRILADLDKGRFRLLSDLHKVIDKFTTAIDRVGREVDGIDLSLGEVRPSVYDAAWAAAMEDPRMLSGSGLPHHWRTALAEATRSR